MVPVMSSCIVLAILFTWTIFNGFHLRLTVLGLHF
uniref:Uncharacterized protein n=1 Tax=Rhizophora mucronata TaxID=61149 RepID=A0A2P2JVK5_RHIMU